jgi:GGDEF domain-containing protein
VSIAAEVGVERDGVTGLPGRTAVRDRLTRLLAAGKRPALYLIAVEGYDRLTTIDPAGARDALRQAARRLDRLVRSSDLLAVDGPDTFALVGTDVAPSVAGALMERIEGAMALPVEVDGSTVSMQVRIGLAFSLDDSDADDLVARATADLARLRGQG